MSDFIVESKNNCVWITINRPEAMNALTQEADIELYDILDEIERLEQVRAVVIKGAGNRAFCAGADLKQRQQMNAKEKFLQAGYLRRVIAKIEEIPQPVIAAIRGYCYGGGFELALACDFRIASESAVFNFPEMTLGAFPGSGGPVRLCRLIQPGYAKEILMTAKKLKADEAREIGIVSRLVSDDALEAEAEAICADIQKSTFRGVSSVKTIINSIQNHEIQNSFALSNALREGLESSSEYVARIDKHFEEKKR